MGLAWTAMGGSTLYIEAVAVDEDRRRAAPLAGGVPSGGPSGGEPVGPPPDVVEEIDGGRGGGGGGGGGSGRLQLTGQLGDVMRESAAIALTYARRFYRTLRPGDNFFVSSGLHLVRPGEGGGGLLVSIPTPFLPRLFSQVH